MPSPVCRSKASSGESDSDDRPHSREQRRSESDGSKIGAESKEPRPTQERSESKGSKGSKTSRTSVEVPKVFACGKESATQVLRKLNGIRQLAGDAQELRRKEFREETQRGLHVAQFYNLLLEDKSYDPVAIKQHTVLNMLGSIQSNQAGVYFFSPEEVIGTKPSPRSGPSVKLRDAAVRNRPISKTMIVTIDALYRILQESSTREIVALCDATREHLNLQRTTSHCATLEPDDGTNAMCKNGAGLCDLYPWLFIADAVSHVIWRINIVDKGPMSLFAGVKDEPGYRNGPLLEAQFNSPLGLAADRERGSVYVCDSDNNSIRHIDLKTQKVSTVLSQQMLASEELCSVKREAFVCPKGIACIFGEKEYLAHMDQCIISRHKAAENIFAEAREALLWRKRKRRSSNCCNSGDDDSSVASSFGSSSTEPEGEEETDDFFSTTLSSEERGNFGPSLSSSSLAWGNRHKKYSVLMDTDQYSHFGSFAAPIQKSRQSSRVSSLSRLSSKRNRARTLDKNRRSSWTGTQSRWSQSRASIVTLTEEPESEDPPWAPEPPEHNSIRLAVTCDHMVWYISLENPEKQSYIIAGDLSGGYGYKDSPIGVNARFSSPKGIINIHSCLFVADYWNNVIRCVNLFSTQVDTVLDFAPEGPVGFTLSASGILYCLDGCKIHSVNVLRITSAMGCRGTFSQYESGMHMDGGEGKYESMFSVHRSRASSTTSNLTMSSIMTARTELWDSYARRGLKVSREERKNDGALREFRSKLEAQLNDLGDNEDALKEGEYVPGTSTTPPDGAKKNKPKKHHCRKLAEAMEFSARNSEGVAPLEVTRVEGEGLIAGHISISLPQFDQPVLDSSSLRGTMHSGLPSQNSQEFDMLQWRLKELLGYGGGDAHNSLGDGCVPSSGGASAMDPLGPKTLSDLGVMGPNMFSRRNSMHTSGNGAPPPSISRRGSLAPMSSLTTPVEEHKVSDVSGRFVSAGVASSLRRRSSAASQLGNSGTHARRRSSVGNIAPPVAAVPEVDPMAGSLMVKGGKVFRRHERTFSMPDVMAAASPKWPSKIGGPGVLQMGTSGVGEEGEQVRFVDLTTGACLSDDTDDCQMWPSPGDGGAVSAEFDLLGSSASHRRRFSSAKPFTLMPTLIDDEDDSEDAKTINEEDEEEAEREEMKEKEEVIRSPAAAHRRFSKSNSLGSLNKTISVAQDIVTLQQNRRLSMPVTMTPKNASPKHNNGVMVPVIKRISPAGATAEAYFSPNQMSTNSGSTAGLLDERRLTTEVTPGDSQFLQRSEVEQGETEARRGSLSEMTPMVRRRSRASFIGSNNRASFIGATDRRPSQILVSFVGSDDRRTSFSGAARASVSNNGDRRYSVNRASFNGGDQERRTSHCVDMYANAYAPSIIASRRSSLETPTPQRLSFAENDASKRSSGVDSGGSWETLQTEPLSSALRETRYPNIPLSICIFQSESHFMVIVGLISAPTIIKVLPPQVHKSQPHGRFNVLGLDAHRFVLADESSHQLHLVNYSLKTRMHLAGCGKSGYLDGPLTIARLNSPTALALDPHTHYIYIADKGNHLIRKIDLSTGLMSTVCGNTLRGNSDSNERMKQALDSPFGLSFLEPHYLLISCADNSIRKFDLKTNNLETILVGS